MTYRFYPALRLCISALVLSSVLVTALGMPGPAYAAASLTITPITWNVVGLDSNDVNAGPNNFPVGARVCNTGDATANNVSADFIWDTSDPYINLRSGSLDPIALSSLAAGGCTDFYFEVEITRIAAAYDNARRYHIEVDSDETLPVSTPTPREIYVEHLVSQNRNSVTDVQLDGVSIAPGGTMNLNIGDTYEIKLIGSTATNGYEQIETFINIPNTIFQILDVDTTYTAHTGIDPDYLTKLYSDACGWVNDPTDVTAPAYRECAGTGKDGGDITVTYQVLIIATTPSSGNVLNTLIYDFSGSSYHYNNDYSTSTRIYDIIDPNACTQSTIAEWTFASSTTTASTDNAVGTPSITAANVTGPNFLQGGNPNPGIAYSDWPNAIDTTKYVQFNVSTEGYYNVNASYDAAENNSNGPDSLNFYYSPNGTTFTQDGGTQALTTSFASSNHDLTSLSSLDDNANVAFRFIGFAATQTTRFLQLDNVNMSGCKLPSGLSLAKTGNPGHYTAAGQTITYTYTLTNTGSVSLQSPYDIDDNLISDANISCAGAASPLGAGASTTCTGTYTMTLADVAAGSVTNTATADASTVIGDPVTSNQATETINLADLSILKQVSASASGPWSDSVTVDVGDTVYFQITVDNIGTFDLTGVAVDDGMAACTLTGPSGDTDSDNELDASETWIYTCSITAVAGTNTNTATADSNETAQENDDAQYNGANPSFTIDKIADVASVDAAGDVISYTITLTNTGNVALTGVIVSDPLIADLDCDGTAGAPFVTTGLTIPVSGTLMCNGTYTVTQADINNNGGGDDDIDNTVTGDTDQTGPQTDSLAIGITQNPELTLVKSITSGDPYDSVGDVISYSFLVENTGNVSLTGPVTIDDDKSTNESCPAVTTVGNFDGELDPGETITCSASYTVVLLDLNNGSVTNTADASADGTTSNTDTETADAALSALLNIIKEISDDNTTWVDNVNVNVGDTVYYRVRVQNIGTQTLTGLSVTDPDCTLVRGGDLPGDNDSDFEAGETWVYYCNVSAVAGTHVNTATADSTETPVDTDDAQYFAQNDPSALSKTLADTNQTFTSGTNAAIGEILIYEVELTIPPGTFTSAQLVDTLGHGLAFVSCESITSSNPGLTTSIGTFADVCAAPTVADLGPDPDEDDGRQVTYDFGTLTNSSGSDQTLTVRYRAVALDIGDNQAGITLQNSADFTSSAPTNLDPVTTTVTLVEPDLDIQKTTDNSFIANGTQVTFTLTVTHTPSSQTDAFNVIVVDVLPTGLDFVGVAPVCTAGFVSCTYDLGTRTVRAEWSSFTLLPAGNNLQVTFTVQGNASLPSGGVTNVASVEWSSLPGIVTAQSSFNIYSTERYYDPGATAAINNYGDSDSLTLNPVGEPEDPEDPGDPPIRRGFLIPVTGFTPNVVTDLRGLPVARYDASLGVVLEIPRLKLRLPIVGVPLQNGLWDVTSLTSQVGWLQKTAFPGFTGNSVLTSHVTSAFGSDGPFANLYKVSVGDKIFVHTFGELHIYEVKSVREVAPNDISILQHEEKSWLTLVTCSDYDEATQTYQSRLVVRAVLIETREDTSSPGR